MTPSEIIALAARDQKLDIDILAPLDANAPTAPPDALEHRVIRFAKFKKQRILIDAISLAVA